MWSAASRSSSASSASYSVASTPAWPSAYWARRPERIDTSRSLDRPPAMTATRARSLLTAPSVSWVCGDPRAVEVTPVRPSGGHTQCRVAGTLLIARPSSMRKDVDRVSVTAAGTKTSTAGERPYVVNVQSRGALARGLARHGHPVDGGLPSSAVTHWSVVGPGGSTPQRSTNGLAGSPHATLAWLVVSRRGRSSSVVGQREHHLRAQRVAGIRAPARPVPGRRSPRAPSPRLPRAPRRSGRASGSGAARPNASRTRVGAPTAAHARPG